MCLYLELTVLCGQLAHCEWLFSNQRAAHSAFYILLVGNYTSGMLRSSLGHSLCVYLEGW